MVVNLCLHLHFGLGPAIGVEEILGVGLGAIFVLFLGMWVAIDLAIGVKKYDTKDI